ncbi:MAG TPA: hypothetical protein VFA90_07460 [Terriglobales bacterium]|nr:hypothetical protein [Terriglobales bacterium]
MPAQSPIGKFDPALQACPYLVTFPPEWCLVVSFGKAQRVLQQTYAPTPFDRDFGIGTHNL